MNTTATTTVVPLCWLMFCSCGFRFKKRERWGTLRHACIRAHTHRCVAVIYHAQIYGLSTNII
jgi:hypothetical protein